MKKNMGVADRVIRTIIAIALIALYLGNIVTGTWGVVALIVAAVFLLTSVMSFCPLYTIFGIKTCPAKS